LARDATEVVEHQGEVTQAQVIAVIEAHPRAERVAQEGAALLASAHVEADEVVRRVFLLDGKHVAACQAQDTIEAKLSSLAEKAATTDW
jgi:hypothetical protein